MTNFEALLLIFIAIFALGISIQLAQIRDALQKIAGQEGRT